MGERLSSIVLLPLRSMTEGESGQTTRGKAANVMAIADRN